MRIMESSGCCTLQRTVTDAVVFKVNSLMYSANFSIGSFFFFLDVSKFSGRCVECRPWFTHRLPKIFLKTWKIRASREFRRCPSLTPRIMGRSNNNLCNGFRLFHQKDTMCILLPCKTLHHPPLSYHLTCHDDHERFARRSWRRSAFGYQLHS